jgi:threonine dehydrogenase-like Zn-dependent dehydrogenase
VPTKSASGSAAISATGTIAGSRERARVVTAGPDVGVAGFGTAGGFDARTAGAWTHRTTIATKRYPRRRTLAMWAGSLVSSPSTRLSTATAW